MNIFAYIKKNPEKVAVILLALFFLINVCIFYNTFGSLLYDHGREFLVPSAILDGHALYKDILNIYGPLGYYFNALLFGIFGKSFSVLYYSGVVFSAIFLISFYKIVKETIDYIWATILSFFVIASCMFTPSLVSYVTPYSYSLLYALATYSVAIYMIIKFYKTEKIQYAYLTSLIAGICLSCKFEYFLLPLLMLIVFVFIKRIKPVDFIKCFMLLCVFPFISLLLMLWQGLSFNDIYLALKFIKNAAGSDSMIWFHRYIGIYPNIYWLPINLINFLIFVIELSALWLIYAILGRYNRYISIIFTLLLSFLLFFHHVCFTRYALFPIIILLLFLFNFRKLYKQYTLCLPLFI